MDNLIQSFENLTMNKSDSEIEELCKDFEQVSINDDIVLLKHKSGVLFYMNSGHCILEHKVFSDNNVPRWIY